MTTYEEFTQLLNGVTNCSDEEKAKNGLQELLHVFEMETMTERVGLLVDNKQIECWSSGGTEDLCDGGILTACMTKLIKRFSTNDEILTSASEIISMSCGEVSCLLERWNAFTMFQDCSEETKRATDFRRG